MGKADAPGRCRTTLVNGTCATAAKPRRPSLPSASAKWQYGSPRLERYNGLPAMEILDRLRQAKVSGAAMDLMEELAAKLPAGIGYDWTGTSHQATLVR